MIVKVASQICHHPLTDKTHQDGLAIIARALDKIYYDDYYRYPPQHGGILIQEYPIQSGLDKKSKRGGSGTYNKHAQHCEEKLRNMRF